MRIIVYILHVNNYVNVYVVFYVVFSIIPIVFHFFFVLLQRRKTITRFTNLKLSIMETKFLLFCEKRIDNQMTVRYLDLILASPSSLSERLELFKSVGVKVFKLVPLFVDEQNGLAELKF